MGGRCLLKVETVQETPGTPRVPSVVEKWLHAGISSLSLSAVGQSPPLHEPLTYKRGLIIIIHLILKAVMRIKSEEDVQVLCRQGILTEE